VADRAAENVEQLAEQNHNRARCAISDARHLVIYVGISAVSMVGAQGLEPWTR